MTYLLCGLAGVVVGAGIAMLCALFLLQRRVDRDLVERRLRALLDYRECLVELPMAWRGNAGFDDTLQPSVHEQAWSNVLLFCKEFRVTCWLLPEAARTALGRIVDRFEKEALAARGGSPRMAGTLGGGNIQRLPDLCGEAERELERAARAQLREHRRLRFFPDLSRRDRRETADLERAWSAVDDRESVANPV